MRIILIKVTDKHNNSDYDVVRDMVDDVDLQGLSRNSTHEPFAGKAKEVKKWCREMGFKYEIHDLQLDIDKKEVIEWTDKS